MINFRAYENNSFNEIYDGIFLLTDKNYPSEKFKMDLQLNNEKYSIDTISINVDDVINLYEKLKKKICFLMPIYPPHYPFAQNFLNSIKKFKMDKQVDVNFIFTNEEERVQWTEGGDFNLILPPDCRLFYLPKGIINIKKFWALDQLKDLYEYIIVLDAETAIIKNIDLYQVCTDYFNDKILLGNNYVDSSGTIDYIKNNCKRFFRNENQISKLDSNLYLWFNQPCIYKTDHLRDFFEITGMHFEFRFTSWLDFDYYIYMYYLILYHNFTIKDMKIIVPAGAAENPNLPYQIADDTKLLKVYLSTREMFQYFNPENIFMMIHIDRSLNEQSKIKS